MKAQAQYTIIEVNDMDSVELGWRNLLKVTAYGTLNGVHNRGTYHTVAIDTANRFNGNNSLKVVCSTPSINGTQDVHQWCWSEKVVGKHIMLSLYVKGSVAAKMWFRLGGATSTISPTATIYNVTTGWTRLEVDLGVVTTTGTVGGISVLYGFNTAGTYYINSLMLEYGNKCGEWSPAPEDINDAIKEVNDKFPSYSTTTQMNTAITQTQNAIMSSVSATYATQAKLNLATTSISNLDIALQAEISRAQGQESALNGKFASYVLTSNYESKVTQLQTSITQEVNERKTFSASIIGANICDNNPITADDKCNDDGETVVNQILKDTNAKIELLSYSYTVSLTDNISKLNANLILTTSEFNIQINNLKTNTSTQIQQLDNEINLKVDANGVIAAINMSSESIKLSANRIDMTGYVTISDLSGGTTTISGDCITSGTITGVIIRSGGVSIAQNTINLTAGSGAVLSGSFNVISVDSGNNVKIGTQSSAVTSTNIYGNAVSLIGNSSCSISAPSSVSLSSGSSASLSLSGSATLFGNNRATIQSENDIYLTAPRIRVGSSTSYQIGFFGATPKSRKGRPTTLDGLIDALADYGFFG